MDADELSRQLTVLRPELLRYANSLSSSFGEDLVQITLEKAFKNADKLKKDSSLKSWLFRILSNAHRTWLRGQQNPALLVEDEHTPIYAERITSRLSNEYIYEAIESLNKRQQQVLNFHALGYDTEWIAETLSIKPTSVRASLCRARRQLKKVIDQHSK